jgi:hypothetical protein
MGSVAVDHSEDFSGRPHAQRTVEPRRGAGSEGQQVLTWGVLGYFGLCLCACPAVLFLEFLTLLSGIPPLENYDAYHLWWSGFWDCAETVETDQRGASKDVRASSCYQTCTLCSTSRDGPRLEMLRSDGKG